MTMESPPATAARRPLGTDAAVFFYLHSLAAGGAERVVSLLANHWVAAGRGVTIATLAPRATDHYPLAPEVARIELRCDGGRGLLANLRRARALRRELRRRRPAVAIAMMETANVLLAVAGAGLPGTACIGSERVHPPRNDVRPVWGWLRRVMYRRLDAVVAQTDDTAAWLRRHTGIARVCVIPNPIATPAPAAAGAATGRTGALASRPFVLGVGRLHQQKGFDLLLRAFARIATEFPQFDLVIVGDGPEREALRRLAGDLGIGARVSFPGLAADIGVWYRAADLYVLSSRFEGFPNTLLEAMAHGCAVVATDCDTGPRDIVRDGHDGLLVPPEAIEPLAAGMARLLGDAQLRAALGRKAVDVCDRFSAARIAARWETLFDEVTI